MALKFVGAMQTALGAKKDEVTLVQMAPERIFRVETEVSEADFRKAMKSRDIAFGGSIPFIEVPTHSEMILGGGTQNGRWKRSCPTRPPLSPFPVPRKANSFQTFFPSVPEFGQRNCVVLPVH